MSSDPRLFPQSLGFCENSTQILVVQAVCSAILLGFKYCVISILGISFQPIREANQDESVSLHLAQASLWIRGAHVRSDDNVRAVTKLRRQHGDCLARQNSKHASRTCQIIRRRISS